MSSSSKHLEKMMATEIGVIKVIVGTVTATSADGTIRTLQVGEKIYSNDLITTGLNGAIEVELNDGSVMDLGRNSQALLDALYYDPNATDTAETQLAETDIAALQQSLIEGQDPTENLEPAGAGAGVLGGNEGHEAVFVDYLAPEVTPEAGFETTGVTGASSSEQPTLETDELLSFVNQNALPEGTVQTIESSDTDDVNIDISSQFSDADGDNLTFSATGLPPGLSIDENGVISGTITASASDATDDNNNTQDYTVSVTVEDGNGGVEVVEFTWTVNNTIPEFQSGSDTATSEPNADSYSFTAPEGTLSNAVIGSVIANDVDGDTLSYRIESGNDAGLFAIDPLTGEISVTKDIDDAELAQYSLEVVVDDGEGGTDTATVSIDLTNVNDGPTGSLSAQENNDTDDVNIDISSQFSDADGDNLTFSATGLPPGLSIDENGVISGTITASASDATDDNNNTQDYTVSVTVEDGNGGVEVVEFTWTVSNTIPEFQSGSDTATSEPNADSYSFTAPEGTLSNAVIGSVIANDVDGDTLSYRIESGNDAGLFAIDPLTGEISVTKDIDDAELAQYSLEVVVDDGEGGTDTATVSIDLTNVNDGPTGSLSAQENNDTDDVNIDISSQFSDADGDNLTFSATGLPPGLSIDENGVISGTITASASDATDDNNNTQDYTVSVTVEDGNGGVEVVEFTWTVNNTIPEFQSGSDTATSEPNADSYSFTAPEGTLSNAVIGSVIANDVDSDTLSYRIESGNDAGLFAIDPLTGEISVTKDIDDAELAQYSLEVVVDDGEGGTDTATVSIDLTNVNDGPTGSLSAQENNDTDDVNIDISSQFSDADGDNLTFSATGLPPGLSIDENGVISGTITASASDTTDDNNNTQDYTVSVTVEDGNGGVEVVEFTWTVNNTIPEFQSGSDTATSEPNADSYSFTAPEGTLSNAVIGSVIANDVDGDTLSYRIESGNDAGLFAIDPLTGEISVTKDIDDAELAQYSLEVVVDDGEGGTDTATVSIDLTNVNDGPTGSLSAQENNDTDDVNIDISSQFSDADGDNLTFSATGLPPGLSIDENGVISGTITASASDTTDDNNNTQDYTVSVTVEDGNGGVEVVEFTWTVNNTIPEFQSGSDTATSEPNADSYSFTAPEGTLSNAVIGSVIANDVDGDTLSYRIESGNDAGLFAIDPLTGEISVTKDIDDAELAQYSLEVVVDDGEGGTDTATVSIDLTNVNDTPTLSVLIDESNVFESGLAEGSEAGSASTVSTGRFTVSDEDGLTNLVSLTIGGQTFNQGVDFTDLSDLVGQSIDVGYGTVALTGYTAGTFDFTYTLDDAVDNDSETGATDTVYDEMFSVSVSDGVTSVSENISITINDDSPTAVDDTDTTVEGVAKGNVITDADPEDVGDTDAGEDAVGADGAQITAVESSTQTGIVNGEGSYTVEGQYGRLTMAANGTYEYTYTYAEQGDLSSITQTAFNQGESFWDAEGRYDASGATGTVTDNQTNGFGVAGTEGQNQSASSQINFSLDEGSQALAFGFGDQTVTAATVDISRLYQAEMSYGEGARWFAFDADGNQVATGIISNDDAGAYANTTDVTWSDPSSSNPSQATFTISDIGAFSTLVFEALPYVDENGDVVTEDLAGQNSDFYVSIESYDVLPEQGDYSDTFTYTLTDGDGDTSSATLTIEGNAITGAAETNIDPVAVETEATGDEDSTGIDVTLSASDVDDSVAEFVIDSLPDNGTLYINGSEVTEAGVVIYASDGEAVVSFVPDADWSGETTFDYHAVDSRHGISDTVTATVNVLPVTDVPIVETTIGDTRVIADSITIDNVTETDSGFTVEAFDLNGDSAAISTVNKNGGTVVGFGVQPDAGADGADVELQQVDGQSEKIVVTFDQPVASLEVTFSWLSNIENAHYVLKDVFGNIIGEDTIRGVTDEIDDAISVSNRLIKSIEFTAPGEVNGGSTRDDYLINNISYTSGVITPVTVYAQATDIDDTETIEAVALTVSVPEGAVLSHGTYISTESGISTWELPLESSGDYVVSFNASHSEVTVDGLTVMAPADYAGEVVVSAAVTVQDGNATPVIGGGEEADLIFGTDEVENIIGGEGDDILFGGEGADIFTWKSGDEGSTLEPANDTVKDFSVTEGDVLDISDLLQGEESNDLTTYLSVTESGDDVVIDITPTGTGDHSQTITLSDTSLSDLGVNVTPTTTQADIVQSLVDNGHIHVDS